jgi:hypothetical protein
MNMNCKNFVLISAYFFFASILIGCESRTDEASFSSEGDWVIDLEDSNKRSGFNFPKPPFTPIYMTCREGQCIQYSGVSLKLIRNGNEIKLSGRDSKEYDVHLPIVNFSKFPELEFRFRIISQNSLEQLRTDGKRHLKLIRRTNN